MLSIFVLDVGFPFLQEEYVTVFGTTLICYNYRLKTSLLESIPVKVSITIPTTDQRRTMNIILVLLSLFNSLLYNLFLPVPYLLKL